MSLASPKAPLLNSTTQPIGSGLVLNVDENSTRVNQIHGINPNNANGSGIPKQVTNVQAVIGNAQTGATNTVSILFHQDPTDTAFSGVNVWIRGYNGNPNLVQVASGTSSPCKLTLNNTGEIVSFTIQAFGNGGNAPISQSPTCSGTLPKSSTGGFGSNTNVYITNTNLPASTARTASITYTIDGNGSTPSTGAKGQVSIPTACTIKGWVLTADASGSAVVDVLRSTYSAFPTTGSIASTDKPTLTSVQKNENLSVSVWTTAINAGDEIQFNLNSVTTCTRLNLTLNVTIP